MTAPRPSLHAVIGVVGAWFALKVHSAYAWVIQVNQFGDTDYYAWASRNALRDGSVARWLSEYPTPAAWFLQLPLLAGATTDLGYRATFMVLVSLVDLAFLLFLLGRLGVATAAAWLVLVTLAGQLALLRLDLVPAVLAGAGLLLALRGRASASAVVIALGTAAKLWPILLFPLVLTRRGSRLRATGVFAAAGVVLAGASIAGAGLPRLLSPLDYQADRGLQVEAVAATLPMLAALSQPGYEVYYSVFKAYEIRGPGVPAMLQAASVASVVALVLAAGLLVWWWLRDCPPEAGGYLGLLLVVLFIVTSKAYSPQYTLWVAALAVVLFGASRVDPAQHEPLRAGLVLGLTGVLMLLTTTIYPTYYGAIVGRNEHSRFALGALALRNSLILALAALLVVLVVDRLRRPRATGGKPDPIVGGRR